MISTVFPSPFAGEGAPQGRMGGARPWRVALLHSATPSPTPPRKGEGLL